jgi:hypothetical protein
MTDARVAKFINQGVGAAMAVALVAAGFNTPRDVMEADTEDLPEGWADDSVVYGWQQRGAQ